jgi:hypothetical protein
VGLLMSNRPSEEQIPTAELPKPEGSPEPEAEKLTAAEIEITTADTQPLPPELRHVVEEASSRASKEEQPAADAKVHEGMESKVAETRSDAAPQDSQRYEGAGEILLDLGDYARSSNMDDDFALDIDLDETPEPSPAEAAFPASASRNRDRYRSSARVGSRSSGATSSTATATVETPAATTDQLATTLEFQRNLDEAVNESAREVTAAGSQAPEAPAEAGSLRQLSPEMIDAIARRAVEHLSEKVVEEIAWEVVPQLAELMIRRQLEEKSS